MLRDSRQSRTTRYGAILASLLICVAVPRVSAGRQTSSSETAPKPTTAKKSSSGTHHSSKRTSRKSKSKRVRGQQKIDSGRATSIQQALIREHYLSGEPSGVWDGASEAAMRRYQSDHGWQTKEVPDSRALITLGLGPNNDHLLNPESAMTSTPIAHRSDISNAGSHASDDPAKSDAAPSAKPVVTPQPAPPGPTTPATTPKVSDDSTNPQ